MEESNQKGFTLVQLYDGIEKANDSIPKTMNNPDYKDLTRIVFIGNTGAGKSTLLHILVGDKMTTEYTDDGFLFKCQNSKIPHIVIGGGVESVTVIPGTYVDQENGLIFIDTPGLLDTKGVFQRILNAYSIHTVLKAGGKMKILFVIDRDAFYSRKGMDVIENFEILNDLVPDNDVLKQCLSLAITKAQKNDEITGFFNYLKTKGGEDYELPWLVDYFMNEGKDEIFMVPEAEDEGVYDNFTEFDKAFEILKRHPAESPKNEIVVDQSCIDQMKILAKQLKNQTTLALEHFKEDIPALYEKEKDINQLNNLDQKFSSLLEAAQKGLDQFGHQISIIFPNHYNDIIDSIQKMKPWREFLVEIMDEDTVAENLYVDISSLVNSLSGHLNNIRQLEKEQREHMAHLDQMNEQINMENLKFTKDVNDLEQKAKNNEISQAEKEKQLNQLYQNHNEQAKRMENDKLDFEKKSEMSFNSMIEAINRQNNEYKEKLSQEIQSINNSFNQLQRENAILQVRLEYETREKERQEREWREKQERLREENERHQKEKEEMKTKYKAKIREQKSIIAKKQEPPPKKKLCIIQ